MDDKQRLSLMEIYRQNPCRTLANALWKTTAQSDELRVDFERQDNALTSLAVWQEKRLMALWCENPKDAPLSLIQIDQLSFALVHSSALPIFEHRRFSHQEAYFRLIHNDPPPVYNCPPGFAYQDVHPQTEVIGVANFIKACYEDIKVDAFIVREWLSHPVYEPALWVWVVDKTANQPAALGIGEVDRRVPEASLEWIQVLPPYRNKGLGKALVGELLRRISGVVSFTTVAGKIDHPTHPERLYQGCGFSGRDVWWLLTF